ncbi:MAG: cysteine-rich CWC family protein [Anaerolineae bacterium]|jgi:hypothetical protein|nr:cysteine-rich CWC family protein [Anaerolineae bacterium]MBT3714050.1 cysteine-rich CWC family protein [Anaerolineae bacterium]MBT4309759.1 cysteine-rich CWC family protein [Anaerolineae bacterium]MBT4457980.1 cysteine-rich CWC family protein [Anaerolineae bacterium]MBT4841344.1 cysteine-rich CWC family protein [Anaerolineae bacterium]
MNSTRNLVDNTPPNTAVCPLCGEPNQCAVAADPNATECWCESVIFPEELLEKVPKDAVRKTCICQKCLERFEESAKPQ